MDAGLRRFFWQPPRTHRDVVPDRRVSFLELFYDLIYVVMIARVAELLHHDITFTSVLNFAILFGLLWVGWHNGTILADAHGRQDLRTRALTFLQMFAITVMAVFAPTADGDGGLGFGVAYLAFLLILVVQWVAVMRLEWDDPLYGPITRSYTLMMSVIVVGVTISLFVSSSVRMWIWGATVVIFVAGMAFGALTSKEGPEAGAPMATESMLERFALFVIIVLGEVVAGVVAGLGAVAELTSTVFFPGFAGLAVGMALWWTYFDMLSERPPRATVRARFAYNLLQLPLTMAIAGVGAVTVALIEGAIAVDDAANWAFAFFVALAELTVIAIGSLLRDRVALQEMLGPAVWTGLAVASLALVLPLLHPAGVILAAVLFLAMCVQWAISVRGWLRTPEGRDALAKADPTLAGEGAV